MTGTAPDGAAAAPTLHRREFGGVRGNLVLILGLPLFTASLYFSVRWNDGALLPTSPALISASPARAPSPSCSGSAGPST